MNYIEIKKSEAKKIIKDGGCVYAVRNYMNQERFIVKIYDLDRLDQYTHKTMKLGGYFICKDKDDI